MRVYYDENKNTVVIDTVSRYFRDGNLVAEVFGDDIAIKYEESETYEVFANYQDYQDGQGVDAGSTPQEVADYLNGEFQKDGIIEGETNFNGVDNTVNVIDDRLTEGDTIYVTPTVNVLNEFYFPTIVVNNSFTVNRIVINALNGLTVNLPFKWRKLI
jgi:hypothetical protein